MPIDTENELSEILCQLSKANGYFDCEKVITQHIKKQIVNGVAFSVIKKYLKTILRHFDGLALKTGLPADCDNYRFAACFVKTLVTTSYWYSWIKRNN